MKILKRDALPEGGFAGLKEHRLVKEPGLFGPQGFNSSEQFYTYLRDAFDVLYEEGAHSPKMLSIGMHARLLGRPGRIQALKRFIEHITSHDKVWVARRADIARHWRQQFPAE